VNAHWSSNTALRRANWRLLRQLDVPDLARGAFHPSAAAS